jgi:hypothetical protein
MPSSAASRLCVAFATLVACALASFAGEAARAAEGAFPLRYDAKSACIGHHRFANDVLPAHAGEFGTYGLDAAYWGGTHARSERPAASWPGYAPSWGKFQYDTYFGSPHDGSGHTPFAVTADTGAPGAPQALRILAEPMPAGMRGNPAYGTGWTATKLTARIVSPPAGGSIVLRVADPNVTHQGWLSGIGRPKNTGGGGVDDPQGVAFVGTVTAGGCTVGRDGACTGGTTSLTLSNVRYFEGGPGTVVPADSDVQDWQFPDYYSGALDTDVSQRYGFFVARIRLPKPLPALSPAWWMLETGGVGENPPGSGNWLRSEWDVEEQFGAAYGYDLNAGNILWNSGTGANFAYGCGLHCPAQSNTTQTGATGVYAFDAASRAIESDYHAAYHEYGVLVSPGGPPFPTNYAGSHGAYVENNAPLAGTTFFLDGYPIAGHVGGPDLTQGGAEKELMLMFQVSAPGSWLDPEARGKDGPWPQAMWIQWLRAYRPTSEAC